MAQLGEQQVKGCASRITHLESDLAQRLDSLKQQQALQASSMLALTASMEQMPSHPSNSTRTGQVDAPLSQLDARVTELQTAAAAVSWQEEMQQLEEGLNALKHQMSQLQEGHASQRLGANSLDDLCSSVAALKSEVHDSLSSKQSTDSMVAELKRDLTELKHQLEQLSTARAEEAGKNQQPVLQLEQTVNMLKDEVEQLQQQKQDQHTSAESTRALEDGITNLTAQLRQVQTQLPEVHSVGDVHSGLKQDLAAVKDQVSSLRTQLHQSNSGESALQESQKLRSELTAVVQSASSTEAAVTQHSADLSRCKIEIAELQAELSKMGQTRDKPQAGHQNEVEELNERLFELRVEVQNLADDTGISVASITRKVTQIHRLCIDALGHMPMSDFWKSLCTCNKVQTQGTPQQTCQGLVYLWVSLQCL